MYTKIMALFIRQNDERSELQQRLAAELREKAQKAASGDQRDGVTDSPMLKDTQQTNTKGWLWAGAAAIAATVVVLFVLATS